MLEGMIAIFCRNAASVFMALLVTTVLVVGAQSCGGSNALYGSVSEADNLQYDSTIFGVQTTFITIAYVRKDGEVVAKLAIDTNGLSLASGVTLSGNDFLTHVTVSRNVTDQNQMFRPVVRGSINFNDYSTAVGGSLSGHFAVTFDSGDILSGDFSGNLVNDNTASARLLPRDLQTRQFGATGRLAWAIPLRFN
jgi:hypothetical protein